MHKELDDEVEVVTPRGRQSYTIIDLATLHDLDGSDVTGRAGG